MPRGKARHAVKISASTVCDDSRIIELRVIAQRDKLSLSDLLAQEGAIQPLEALLISAIKESIREYEESGKVAIQQLKSPGKKAA